VKYTASIFRIEVGKDGKMAGYREVGGKEMSVGPQAYLPCFWSGGDMTATILKQTFISCLVCILYVYRKWLKPYHF
jgi:hypothetical protein